MQTEAIAGEDGYILHRTEAEYERLRNQARFWEGTTARVLQGAGLAPGMRCLDVGCGPGEVMRLMGGMTGPHGVVVGLDIDAALGAYAVERLRAAGGADYRFAAADITRGDPVPGGPFDLVFARFLLIHMTDPVAVARRLAAQVAPGGKLVLMDYDLSRMAVRPDEPTVRRGLEVVTACFERSGKHADTGLRLPQFLLEAGLPPPDGCQAVPVYGSASLVGRMLREVLAGLTSAAETLGVASKAEIAELIARCREVEEAGRHYMLGPSIYGVWTTSPPDPRQARIETAGGLATP